MSKAAPALVVAAAALLGLAGCNDDGRTLAPAPAPTAPPVTGSAPGVAGAFSLSSPDVVAGAAFPLSFTCDGEDIPPRLDIGAPPPGTVELAVSLVDHDAGGFVHWVVAGVPPDLRHLDGLTLPAGAVEATNDFGEVGYGGPCPPAGEVHEYTFTVYALPAASGLASGVPGREAVGALAAAQTGTASFSALGQRTAG